MFEDLIPSASAQTPAPPPGMFDDLIPAGGAAGTMAGGLATAPGGSDGLAAPTASTDAGGEEIGTQEGKPALPFPGTTSARSEDSSSRGLFDDLIPAPAMKGAVVGGVSHGFAPEYEPILDPSLGLKDAKTGIPLVRESKPGRFIADVAGEDDGGLFWKDPETGEIRRPGPDELIRPVGGKFKVYERDEIVRPWTVADMALARAIVSGFTAAHDAFAGNVAPHEVIPRALDFAMFGLGGARTLRPRGQTAAETAASSSREGVIARSADTVPADAGAGLLADSQPGSLSAASPDFAAGVLRIAGKALESARASLRDMFEAASVAPPMANKTIDLGFITPEGAAWLNTLLRRAGTDVDVSGFRHTVDSYSVRHSLTGHGDIATEALRGQVALTADDWAMIPTVLSSPDLIKVLPRKSRGLDSIGYWKRVNGHILYVEEVRTGRHTLAAVTMQKFKEGEAGVSGVPGGPDGLGPPGRTARTDPGSENISGADHKD